MKTPTAPYMRATGAANTTRALLCLAMSLLTVIAPGCRSSYTEKLQDAHVSMLVGDPTEAMAMINKRLGVKDMTEVPTEAKKDTPLLLLERGMLLQAMTNYKLAARDMMLADQSLVWLDIRGKGAEEIGKYLYSDDASRYVAPPYERLLLNTLNMINFLAMYDLEGARVEARRFTVMESYYVDAKNNKTLLPGLVGLGNYFSGAVFEASQRYDEAARYYSRAWYFGVRDPDLKKRLLDLYRVTGYRERKLQGAFFARLGEDAEKAGGMTLEEYQEAHQRGDVLVVVQYGMAPYKKATRLPASQALSKSATGKHALSPQTRRRAATLMGSGSLNTINFPELTELGLPTRTSSSATVTLNTTRVGLSLGMDVKTQVRSAWGELSGPLMSAALTRAITRAAVGQAGKAGAAAGQGGGGAAAAAGVVGWLASVGLQSAMSASDTPDTRSWTTLPAYILIGRTKLPRGMHQAEANISGRSQKQSISVWPQRLNVVNFSRIR